MHDEGSWYGNVVLEVDRGCTDLVSKDFFSRLGHDAVEAVKANKSYGIIALAPMLQLGAVRNTINRSCWSGILHMYVTIHRGC